ncbi:ABC transporter ATP-binding protein [Cellulomonas sp. URHD0024]|uniref:ABC transporter ATP-binding protein n=1 Tax=Cellulomonas sp. URHD0024 TaxID=1302620 RepID=UPI000400085D|nr:ABC transporter ATP-binding protein [Cellulomonas sp. URHD0024]
MTGLRACGIVRRFGPVTAVDGVDLDVLPGQVHALVGLNGSGKTTLMRMLVGVLRPDEGLVRFDGAAGPHGALTGHVIDVPAAYGELTVAENLWAAARLRGVPGAAARSAAAVAAAAVGIDDLVGRRAAGLSLGNRQRLGLASALVHDPEVLILDEPTNGLDPAGVLAVRRLLLDRAHEHGCAVLVSSHHLDELARIADRITVLHRGRVVGALEPDGVDLEARFFAMVAEADGLDLSAEPPLVPGGRS